MNLRFHFWRFWCAFSGGGGLALQFRGPLGDGIAADAKLPSNLEPRSVAWTAELPGRGLSSPVGWGSGFVTSTSGAKQDRLHVLCFNLADGTLRWERQFWATGRTMTHEKISGATRRLPAMGSTSTPCFPPTTALPWISMGTSSGFAAWVAIIQTPAIPWGCLRRSSCRTERSLPRLRTMRNRLLPGSTRRPGSTVGSSTAPNGPIGLRRGFLRGPDGRTQILLQSSKGVTAVDPASGKTLWSYDEGASHSAFDHRQWRSHLCSLHRGLTVLEPGVEGKAPRQVWRSAQLRPGTSSPLVVGPRLYAQRRGILTCGKPRRVPGFAVAAQGAV